MTDAFGGSDRTRQQQGGRKRQKFEYVPLSRTVESHGVWDLGQVEDLVANVGLRKKVRSYGDLGTLFTSFLVIHFCSRFPKIPKLTGDILVQAWSMCIH